MTAISSKVFFFNEKMVSEHWPTYAILAIYVAITAIVTLAAKKKNDDPNDEKSEITKHFLGSKNFGPVLLMYANNFDI